MNHYLGFIVCATVVFFAGKKLSYYGDQIAEITGIGKAVVGIFLMSAVTTLPELVVGISASAIVEAPDLATGNVLGSCAFNLMLLVIMDASAGNNRPVLHQVSKTHILAASLGSILLALVGAALFLEDDVALTSFIGLNSISFLVLYFISLRLIYKHQQVTSAEIPGISSESAATAPSAPLKKVVTRYVLFAVIIIAAALALPPFADSIAEETGLGKSFIGTILLAASTSLPEIAVTVSAVRMKATDLAVGNVLGSNIFNIFILFVNDLFYQKGHILKDSSDAHLITVFGAIIMSAIVVLAIIYDSPKKKFRLSSEAFAIFGVYLVTVFLLFRYA